MQMSVEASAEIIVTTYSLRAVAGQRCWWPRSASLGDTYATVQWNMSSMSQRCGALRSFVLEIRFNDGGCELSELEGVRMPLEPNFTAR